LAGGAFWSFSRGAVILFFAGLAVWALGRAGQIRSIRWAALLAALILAGVSVFTSFGGDTARRFFGEGVTVGFRSLIYRDSLAMLADGPWCGVGLGSFSAVFPQYRAASIIQQSVLHPESDWLWVAAETGWPGVAGILLMAGAAFVGAFPLSRGSGRAIRWACLVATMLFAVHAAIDVSGHRLGTVLPILLLASMALAEGDPARPIRSQRDPAPDEGIIPNKRRGLAGIAFAAAGIGIAAGGFWLATRPDPAAMARRLMAGGSMHEARARATEALRERPIDWELAFLRGTIGVAEKRYVEALSDFKRARFLVPHSIAIPFEEGRTWATAEPRLVVPAWREALARCGEHEFPEWFRLMMREAPSVPGFVRGFRELAEGRPSLLLDFVASAESAAEADYLLGELEPVSAKWGEADRDRLRFLAARQKAVAGDLAKACETLFGLLPVAPRPERPARSLSDAMAAHFRHPADPVALWDLSQAHLASGDLASAAAALDKAAVLQGCPPHFDQLRALLHAEQGNWREAWEATEASRRLR
jgi:hypothetical protein